MKHEGTNEALLRKYLLGELDEANEQAFEEQLLADAELSELLLSEEDELVDDYLSGELSAEELERFDSHFMVTPERQRKLRFGEAWRTTHALQLVEKPENDHSDFDRTAAEPGANRPSSQDSGVNDSGEKEEVAQETVTDLPPQIVGLPAPVVIGPQSWWTRAISSPYLRIAATVAIALGLGVGTWRVFFHRSEIDEGIAALAKAYADERPVEARISGLAYAPYPRTRGASNRTVDIVSRDRAERILLDAVAERSGPDARHALGEFYLAERRFEDAIKQFEEAEKANANNPTLHSDYGAALFEKGKADLSKNDTGISLEQFARSLEQLNKALELDGTLLDARFNRALLYQQMMMPDQAEQDWRTYLEQDPNSRWSREASQNLKQIEEKKRKSERGREEIFKSFLAARQAKDDAAAWKVISRSHARTGNIIAERLVDDYLDSAAKEREEGASGSIQLMSYAGELGAQKAGDRYLLDLARLYRLASAKQRTLLAEARRLMRLGHQEYDQAKDESAVVLFGRAKQLFDTARDVFESEFAEYWIGFCYYNQNNLDRSQAIFERLSQACQADCHKWLRVRALYGLSAINFKSNEYSKALRYGVQSVDLAETIGDASDMLNTLTALTEYYRYIGNYQRSLYCIQRSLPLIDLGLVEPSQIWRHYIWMASTFSSLSYQAAALGYQKEALGFSLNEQETSMICVSYAHLGLIYQKLGNHGEAINNIRHAFETARSHSEESVGQQMMAYSSLQMGHLYRENGDFPKAVESYSQCIELYNELDFTFHRYQAVKGRLLCYVALKDDRLAEEEIRTALDLVEKYRAKILEGENRNNFFGIEQSVYDLAIDFACARPNNAKRAFEYSEISRARSLLDLLSANARVSAQDQEPDVVFQSVAHPLSLTEIQERLPEQTQVLQYAVLEDKLVAWVISKTEISPVIKSIAQADLSKKVLAYLKTISDTNEDQSAEGQREAKELYELLIGQIEPLLDKNKEVCIVPDKILNYLPFGALVSPASGRYLLRDYRLLLSPSASVFVICSSMAREKEGARAERILSVGNPRFDRDAFPSLSDLPSAAREAEEVASFYDQPRALVDKSAGIDGVRREVAKSDVIHLALHSIVDERAPMNSKLVLAKEPANVSGRPSSDGALSVYEIYKMKLSRTRLVVLSACQTGVGRYYKGEGMLSLARPFIAAGVPLVSASLWPVDSDSTADLMVSFHRHRKRDGLSTVAALRSAQLEMLDSPEDRLHRPYYWAAFVAIGGHANF